MHVSAQSNNKAECVDSTVLRTTKNVTDALIQKRFPATLFLHRKNRATRRPVKRTRLHLRSPTRAIARKVSVGIAPSHETSLRLRRCDAPHPKPSRTCRPAQKEATTHQRALTFLRTAEELTPIVAREPQDPTEVKRSEAPFRTNSMCSGRLTTVRVENYALRRSWGSLEIMIGLLGPKEMTGS